IPRMVHSKALIEILGRDGGKLAIGTFELGDRKGSQGQGLDDTDIYTRLAQGNGLVVHIGSSDRIFSIRVPGSEKKNPHSNSATSVGINPIGVLLVRPANAPVAL